MRWLEESIQYVKGVGPKRAKRLKRLGIETVEDALYYFPRDYEYWQDIKPISSVKNGETVSLKVRFLGDAETVKPKSRLTITRIPATDGTGQVHCIWYNQPYRAKTYSKDRTYFIHGKAEYRYGMLQIDNPLVEEYDPYSHDGARILPVYHLTEGLTQRDMRKIIKEVLSRVNNQLRDELPDFIRREYNLAEKNFALNQIHFPTSRTTLEEARRRLVFEEFFTFQMALRLIRQKYGEKNEGIVFRWDEGKMARFIKKLPFVLTGAQKKVLGEILSDLKSGRAMNRLIQGDVGSGKTILAALALYCAYLSGYQGAMMVPTEILAEQHFDTFTELFKGEKLKIECITGSTRQSRKNRIKEGLAEGTIDIVIGTHAIIQDDVVFKRLGLVITDEQHRFGVRQRAMLREKGRVPHMLVMSATPIPRTLALIFYGDLDISIVDELPPGRKKVKTYHVTSSMRNRIYDFIRRQVGEGRQVYMVCPLVEESEKIKSRSAVEMFNTLKDGPLSGLRLGLLHGKMKPAEKEKVMSEFAKGEIDVLVATTVIEVGVDVPNATVMVIENAERFGLAQLHQLRGRVGRGSHQSYCILISDAKNSQARERMSIMVRSCDGFEIAEKDLQLRGPGDFVGVRQHGLPEFKIANLARDMEILKQAREAVDKMIMDTSCRNEIFVDNIMQKFNQMISKIVMN